MKGSCEIKLGDGAYLEVHYECWGEGAFIDYDSPRDPSGQEIQKIELHIGEDVIDITRISEELSSELDYDTLERTVEENILNR